LRLELRQLHVFGLAQPHCCRPAAPPVAQGQVPSWHPPGRYQTHRELPQLGSRKALTWPDVPVTAPAQHNERAHVHAPAHTHTTHAWADARTHASMHARTHTHIHTPGPARAQSRAQSAQCARPPRAGPPTLHMHEHMYAHTHTHTHTLTHARTQTWPRTGAKSRAKRAMCAPSTRRSAFTYHAWAHVRVHTHAHKPGPARAQSRAQSARCARPPRAGPPALSWCARTGTRSHVGSGP